MLVSARLRWHSTRPTPQLPSNTTPQACCYRTQRRDTDLGMVVRETGPINAVTALVDPKKAMLRQSLTQGITRQCNKTTRFPQGSHHYIKVREGSSQCQGEV